MNTQTHTRNAALLKDQAEFQLMPARIQEWILTSSNATANFLEFFEKKGSITLEKGILLPYYLPRDPPEIIVDESTWYAAKKPSSDYMQLEMFGTLAHEIGHDRYNTGTALFRGGSAEDYVRYRSELEAHAIFNAFPIFRDLQNDPIFKQDFPFDTIGYVNGILLGQYYKEWCAGRLDDTTVVARIADGVPNKVYDLPTPLMDQNGDDVVTHRDLYLRDYKELILRQPQMAVPQLSRSETTSRPLSTTETDPIQARLAELQREMDALRRQVQHDSPSPPNEPTPRHETNLRANPRSAAMDGPSRSRPEREPEPEPQQPRPQRDVQAFPPGHRDYALFEAIRRQLPDEYSDDMAAHATLEAKRGGITRPDQIKGMAIENGQLTVMGKSGMDFAFVELAASAPPLQETLQQSAAFDRQQSIQLAQFQEQQQQMNMGRGPSMTL